VRVRIAYRSQVSVKIDVVTLVFGHEGVLKVT
jgi:hypothetical protein